MNASSSQYTPYVCTSQIEYDALLERLSLYKHSSFDRICIRGNEAYAGGMIPDVDQSKGLFIDFFSQTPDQDPKGVAVFVLNFFTKNFAFALNNPIRSFGTVQLLAAGLAGDQPLLYDRYKVYLHTLETQANALIQRTQKKALDILEKARNQAALILQEALEQKQNEMEILTQRVKCARNELFNALFFCKDHKLAVTLESIVSIPFFDNYLKSGLHLSPRIKEVEKAVYPNLKYTFDFSEYPAAVIRLMLEFTVNPSVVSPHVSEEHLVELWHLGNQLVYEDICCAAGAILAKKPLSEDIEAMLTLVLDYPFSPKDPWFQKACRTIACHFAVVAQKERFSAIPHAAMVEILKQDTFLGINNEEELFQLVVLWGKGKGEISKLLNLPLRGETVMEQIRLEYFPKQKIYELQENGFLTDAYALMWLKFFDGAEELPEIRPLRGTSGICDRKHHLKVRLSFTIPEFRRLLEKGGREISLGSLSIETQHLEFCLFIPQIEGDLCEFYCRRLGGKIQGPMIQKLSFGEKQAKIVQIVKRQAAQKLGWKISLGALKSLPLQDSDLTLDWTILKKKGGL